MEKWQSASYRYELTYNEQAPEVICKYYCQPGEVLVNLQIWLPGFDSKIKVFDNASPEEAQGGRGSGIN